MSRSSSEKITRRQAVQATGKALAGVAGLDALSSLASAEGLSSAAEAPRSQAAPPDTNFGEKLRIATCQFPVGASATENAKYIRDFMHKAAAEGAHLLHTSEGSLSGYAGSDFPTFEKYNWDGLRKETNDLRALAKSMKMWLVLGSAHFLDENTKPTNCLYLIDPEGKIVDRYDKCFCTEGDQKHYSAGNRLVTQDIRGVKVGLAICYDICWPQLYIAYRKKGVTVMIHSMYNASDKGKNCLDTLNNREVPTRCADNRMWAVANNSSRPYSHWGSFIARPDASIAKELEINKPGMLVHDFPDTLSADGWYHNFEPMDMAENTIMTWGTPSNSPRQRDGQSEP
ncbi:MAG: carbon-nitrogen hydrolase family protein [Terriglobia bacterium]